MEMGGNFCQILELGGATIKGRRVMASQLRQNVGAPSIPSKHKYITALAGWEIHKFYVKFFECSGSG